MGYRHPNGFSKIKLAHLPVDDWSVRLHMWNPDARESDIHDHRWHFASYVASGSIVERRYRLSRGGGPSIMYKCSASLDGSYVLTDAEGCGANVIQEDLHRSGSSYEHDPDTLHQAMATAGSPAVTIFVQGAQVKDSTTVVKDSTVGTMSVLGARLAASEVMDELRVALDLIADA
jgi:hypothetical protein